MAKTAGTPRAALLVVVGLLVAALVVWSSRDRSAKAPVEGPVAPASAPSRKGTPHHRVASPPPPKLGSIAGTVTEPSGAPLPGALVCASAPSSPTPIQHPGPVCASSGDDGRYQIAGLPPSRLTLVASASGHRPASYAGPPPESPRFLQLGEGEARTGVDFALSRGGIQVQGHVKDVGGGAIAGAVVTITGWPGPFEGVVVTRSDAQGAFSAWIEEGHYSARAIADGYAEGWKDGMAPGPAIELLLMPGAALVGRVVEAGTGDPVAGATVEAGLDQGWGVAPLGRVTSDDEGRFRVSGLPPGRYKPTARASTGFGQARESVLLGVAQTSSEITIELHPARSVSGRVVIAPGGEPCEAGSVGLLHAAQAGMADAVIGPDGSVYFQGMLPGSYQVMVDCLDHAPSTIYPPVVLGDADIEGLVWPVRAGLSLRGRVVDDEGRAVRAVVYSTEVGVVRQPGAFASTDDDGRFVLRGLPPGKHRLMVNPEDHAPPDPVDVELLDARAPEVTIVVTSGGAVEGSVADEDNRPIAGAEILVMGQRLVGLGAPVRSLDDGTFAVRGLAAGDYRVWATRQGSTLRAPGQTGDAPPGVPVKVAAGATARVRLVVERQAGEIYGRVVDEGGGPVTDAFLDVDREPEGAGAPARPPRPPWGMWSNAPVLTDPSGEFTIGGLSQGTYTVRAYRKGGGSAAVEHVRVGDTVTLTIEKTGAISGTVELPGGGPAEQFTIRLASQGAPLLRSESFVNSGGAWTLGDLSEGRYQISVEAAEGTAMAEVALARGESRSDVALKLSSRGLVRGQVISLEDRAPVAGVSVRAFSRGSMAPAALAQEPALTDERGQFQLAGVPSGPVMLMAMPADPLTSERDPAMVSIEVSAGPGLDVGQIVMARRRLKPGELPGDLGYSLKELPFPADRGGGALDVGAVPPDGPAAAAGLLVGDVIVSVDGYDVTGARGYLYRSLVSVGEGVRVTLGLARGVSVVIVAERAPAPSSAWPGPPPRGP